MWHFFALRNSWVVFAVCFGLLSICAVKHCAERKCSSSYFYQHSHHHQTLPIWFHWWTCAHAIELLPLCMIVLLNMAVDVPFLLLLLSASCCFGITLLCYRLSAFQFKNTYLQQSALALARWFEWIFLNKRKNLQSYSIVVFCGLFVSVSWPVHSLFLRMYQSDDSSSQFLFSLRFVFTFRLMMTSFTCINISLCFILRKPVKSCQMQVQHFDSTSKPLFAWFLMK